MGEPQHGAQLHFFALLALAMNNLAFSLFLKFIETSILGFSVGS